MLPDCKPYLAIRRLKSRVRNRSGGFNDLSGFQAASAYANALRATADESTNGLQVWIEPPICAVIGVAYGVTKLRSLATDLTAFRHDTYLR